MSEWWNPTPGPPAQPFNPAHNFPESERWIFDLISARMEIAINRNSTEARQQAANAWASAQADGMKPVRVGSLQNFLHSYRDNLSQSRLRSGIRLLRALRAATPIEDDFSVLMSVSIQLYGEAQFAHLTAHSDTWDMTAWGDFHLIAVQLYREDLMAPYNWAASNALQLFCLNPSTDRPNSQRAFHALVRWLGRAPDLLHEQYLAADDVDNWSWLFAGVVKHTAYARRAGSGTATRLGERAVEEMARVSGCRRRRYVHGETGEVLMRARIETSEEGRGELSVREMWRLMPSHPPGEGDSSSVPVHYIEAID